MWLSFLSTSCPFARNHDFRPYVHRARRINKDALNAAGSSRWCVHRYRPSEKRGTPRIAQNSCPVEFQRQRIPSASSVSRFTSSRNPLAVG